MNKTQTCDSKVQHKTETIAQYVISSTGNNATQDYYRCEICGFYHIFTINKPVFLKRMFSYKKRNNKKS